MIIRELARGWHGTSAVGKNLLIKEGEMGESRVFFYHNGILLASCRFFSEKIRYFATETVCASSYS